MISSSNRFLATSLISIQSFSWHGNLPDIIILAQSLFKRALRVRIPMFDDAIPSNVARMKYFCRYLEEGIRGNNPPSYHDKLVNIKYFLISSQEKTSDPIFDREEAGCPLPSEFPVAIDKVRHKLVR